LKEKIYTIPVTDAFSEDSECPFCVLEFKLDAENIDYFLGGALMEPDCRVEMNAHGFCKSHLDKLFDSKKNVLGLGLILTSLFDAYNSRLSREIASVTASVSSNDKKSIFSRKNSIDDLSELINFLSLSRADCVICNKLEKTMDRYISVCLHMWKSEPDFKEVFDKKKGFCTKHFEQVIKGINGELKGKTRVEFLEVIFEMQLTNLRRLQEEVKWFTDKSDYRNNDKPWGNSKDAVQRCIEKLR